MNAALLTHILSWSCLNIVCVCILAFYSSSMCISIHTNGLALICPKNEASGCQMQTVRHTWLTFISIYQTWVSSTVRDRCSVMMDRAADALFLTKAPPLVTSLLRRQVWHDNSFSIWMIFEGRGATWLKRAGCALTRKLGRSSHLLSSTVIQMPVPDAVLSTGCLCRRAVVTGALAKPLSSSTAIGSLLKRAVFSSATFMLFFMTMDRVRVIAWAIKVIKRGDLVIQDFYFSFTICVTEVSCVNVCACVCVCVGGLIMLLRCKIVWQSHWGKSASLSPSDTFWKFWVKTWFKFRNRSGSGFRFGKG